MIYLFFKIQLDDFVNLKKCFKLSIGLKEPNADTDRPAHGGGALREQLLARRRPGHPQGRV